MRTAVIGGGAAGIAMAKALLERGVAFDCFERAPKLGGLWSEDDNGHTVAYRSLHINSSKRQMQFSDYPFPDSYPDFPSRAQVAAYLTDYAHHFGVDKRISLNREVTDLEQTASGWRICLDESEQRTYDAVLVASGHHSSPKLPDNAGRNFDGEVLHSHDVRDAAPFEGKNVLIVGFGNSAVDIASLVSTAAARTYLSIRRGTHVVPKYLFGRPFDELPAPPWPRSVRWAWYALATRVTVGSLQRYGLPDPVHRFGEAAVTISSDLLIRIVHGDVLPRPALSELRGLTASFADGQSDRVDTVIYCTGYRHSPAVLKRRGLDPEGIDYNLFHQVWDPRFDGLAHVGLVQPLGSFFPIFESQAQILADWVTGGYSLPAPSEMEGEIRRAKQRRERQYTASERHVIQVDEGEYRRRLEREHRRGAQRAGARGSRFAPAAALAAAGTRLQRPLGLPSRVTRERLQHRTSAHRERQ